MRFAFYHRHSEDVFIHLQPWSVCQREMIYLPIFMRLFDALGWNASKEQTSQSIKILLIFRNIINKNTNHHYRCDIKMNRSDKKNFQNYSQHNKICTSHGSEKKVSVFFSIISYQSKLCRSHIVKPNDVYMMNGQCFANNFIVLSIWISWMEKVFSHTHTRLAFRFLNFRYLWNTRFCSHTK